MINKILLKITKHRPMKPIVVNDSIYLERYYLFSVRGRQVWLHRFLSGDGERHLHSHPWNAVSLVLCGWYEEELPGCRIKTRGMWSVAAIPMSHVHRIAAIRRNTWTMMFVGESRSTSWKFIDDDGNCKQVVSSPADWWKYARPREA